MRAAAEAGLDVVAPDRPRHRAGLGGGDRGGARRRDRAGDRASRSAPASSTRACTCWPTCPTPTTRPWSSRSTGCSRAATPGCRRSWPACASVGVELTEDDVRRVAAGTPATGRPHVADALVARGVVADRAEAFERYLNPGRPGVRHPVRRRPRGRWSAGRRRRRRAASSRTRGARHGAARCSTEAAFARAAATSGWPASRSTTRTTTPAPASALRAIAAQARPGRHRVQRLPRHRQGRPRARLQHHRARAARADPRAGRASSARARPDERPASTPPCSTSAFVTLFVIMDPVGTVPIFLSLTSGRSKATAPAGGVAGGRRVVRGDHRVRVLRPADPGTTCTSRCRPCSARAACCSCSSRSSC